jgi:rubrerythrin
MKERVVGTQVPPRYYGYRGGYANITICTKCKRTSLYEDTHPANPCPSCGSTVREFVGKWIKPVYKFLFLKIRDGYWQLKV